VQEIVIGINLIVTIAMMMSGAIAPLAKADDPTGNYFDGTEIKCPGVPSAEATVVQCNRMAFQTADRELNAVYQQLMKQADSRERQYLQTMQLAWIQLKESQCGLTQYYYRKAQVSEKWRSRCETVMTIRRVQELKALGTGISW